MAKKKSYPHQEVLELYEKIVSSIAGVDRKGATMPYTSLTGRMFSFLNKDGKMDLRLDKMEREAFLQNYDAHLIISHGTTIKEYVEIPSDLFNNTSQMKNILIKATLTSAL